MNSSSKDLGLISKKIQAAKRILVITHEKPDGDAIGSVLALTYFLNENNIDAYAYFPEYLPKIYDCCIKFDKVFTGTFPEYFDYEIMVSLDCSNLKRLGLEPEIRENIERSNLINIDHHFDNELFGYCSYIDPEACSTCEILYDLFCEMPSFKITKTTAEYILLGMIMDTGGFRFDNSTSKVFYKTAQLIELGADYIFLIKSLYFKNEYNYLKLESDIILNHLNWDFDSKLVYTYMSTELLQKYNIDLKNTEGLIDTFRSLEGVEVAALITKRGNGYKVSLRSNNTDYSVVDVAHKLNGGGHKLAAGCFVEANTIETVKKVLLPLIKKLLKT